jgi:hypothetical protein
VCWGEEREEKEALGRGERKEGVRERERREELLERAERREGNKTMAIPQPSFY